MLLARCCWPVATEETLIAVGPESPVVAKSTAEGESVALELGSMVSSVCDQGREKSGRESAKLTVAKDSGDIIVGEEREGKFEPSHEIGLGVDILRNEERALVCIVADKKVLTVNLLFEKLLARYILNKDAICDRQEAPSTECARSGDIETGVL